VIKKEKGKRKKEEGRRKKEEGRKRKRKRTTVNYIAYVNAMNRTIYSNETKLKV
jgi:hypothetical protein